MGCSADVVNTGGCFFSRMVKELVMNEDVKGCGINILIFFNGKYFLKMNLLVSLIRISNLDTKIKYCSLNLAFLNIRNSIWMLLRGPMTDRSSASSLQNNINYVILCSKLKAPMGIIEHLVLE